MKPNTVSPSRVGLDRQFVNRERDNFSNNLTSAERIATQSTAAERLMRQLSGSDERSTLLAQSSAQSTGEYIVQSGDNLSAIAADNQVSLSDLLAANPQITNPNMIQPGQVINLPLNSAGDNQTPSEVDSVTPTNPTDITTGSVPASQLSVSDAGLEFITSHEGLRLELYNDPAGHATIGVGHLVHLGPIDGRASEAEFANGITRAEAMDLLREDVGTAEDAVRRLVDVPLNQNQFDALVSFTFNLGEGNLQSSTLLRRLNQGEYDAVPSELNRWTRGGGQVLPGLVRRRAEEGELFTTPVSGTVGPGPVQPPDENQVPDAILRIGARGSDVTTLQNLLLDAGFNPGTADGIFGAQTDSAVRDFQNANNLIADGIVGPQTWDALIDGDSSIDGDPSPVTVSSATLRNGARGSDVETLQQVLLDAGFNPGPADGIFGSQTESAVRAYQNANNLDADGIVGPQTWASMGVTVDATSGPSGASVSTGPEGSAADIWVKSSANIDNLSPQIVDTLDDVVAAWAANGGPTPVITSGNDGRHSNGSLHFSNQAIDLRTNNISDSLSAIIAADLQARVGDDYDVIFERFPSNPANDHIHVEYDPD